MPNYAPGQTFDYGSAVAQGNQNAMAQMQAQYQPQIYQNQIRNQQLQRMVQGLQYIKASAPMVTQESYPQWYAGLIQNGLVQPGELPEQYDEKVMTRLATATGKQLEKFGPLTQVPGAAPGTMGQQSLRSDKWSVVAKPPTGMSVDVSPEGAVSFKQGAGIGGAPKGAQTQLFKDYVGGQQALDSISQIKSLYEPEFLTYPGAAKGSWSTFLNKMDPTNRSAFQQRRSAFLSSANREFLAYRKWATGVAGGEKEMAEIKRTTFSEDDSPQDFEMKIQLAESLRRRLNARIKAALAAGIDNDAKFKEFIKQNPLNSVPTLQARGAQLEKLGYQKDKIVQILINEGYIEPRVQ